MKQSIGEVVKSAFWPEY